MCYLESEETIDRTEIRSMHGKVVGESGDDQFIERNKCQQH